MWEKITILFLFSLLLIPGGAFAQIDTDGDGLLDTYESYIGTDPEKVDTDEDGYGDKVEIDAGYSPRVGFGTKLADLDTDTDGLNDQFEQVFGTSPMSLDTDHDGYMDHEEILFGFDPMNPEPVRTLKRELIVDRSTQELYFEIEGHRLHTFPVSTGNPWTPTPLGEYQVQRKVDNKRYVGPGYNLPNVKWNLQFIPMYYIHTAYWHNNFGERTMSHGCINMKEEDAAFLYKYIDVGVTVKVIGENPPGGVVAVAE